MRIDDRLAKQNHEINSRRSQAEDEETMTYGERPVMKGLNRYKGRFSDEKWDGLNTRKSVFDRTAIFHTGEE